MSEKKTTVFANGLIWFGAGLSIAEILTGTLFAPLGLKRGLIAILLGHIIGCAVFFLAGLIGAGTGKSAMETVKLSFGQKGSVFFSSLNVLQLIGWTAVMIEAGASAAAVAAGAGGEWVWCLVIGALIALWLFIGIRNLGKINFFAMSALFALTLVLSWIIFRGAGAPVSGAISFGAAVELAAAMPLSWLPLVSDYTRTAERPFAASAASAGVYFAVSVWMYVIGMGAAVFTGETDIAAIMVKAGLGLVALFIVVLSTVTTTYLDAYSAGVSSASISSKLREKPAAIAVCVLGTVLAVFAPVARFEDFLYLIGSVFAPMSAILITDYFILKKDSSGRNFNRANLIVWLAGFILYRVFMNIDTPVGNTLPVMIITAALCLLVNKFFGGKENV